MWFMAEPESTGKKWTQCNHCGHFFQKDLSFCDECNKPNDGSGPEPADKNHVTTWRATLIGLGVMLVAAWVISGLFFKRHPSILPIATLVALVLGLATRRTDDKS